jgi:hypothetical protein
MIVLHKNKEFYKYFASWEILPKNNNILYSEIAAESAEYIEELEEECLIDVLHEMFTKCFPGLSIPRPVSVIRYSFS